MQLNTKKIQNYEFICAGSFNTPSVMLLNGKAADWESVGRIKSAENSKQKENNEKNRSRQIN